MGRRRSVGRSRITVMLVLGLGIALLGALLLPRLLNEARPPEARTSQASVCFAVLRGEALAESGLGHVSLKTAGRPRLQVSLPLEKGASAAELAGAAADALRGAAQQAGWSEPLAVAAADHCLHLEHVVGVGGDPGLVGLGVSYALALGGAQGGPLRIAIERRGDPAGGPRGRVSLSARRAAAAAGRGQASATANATFETGETAPAILARLAERLAAAGWAYTLEADALVVQGLPDGGALGGLMLSVEYEAVPDGPAATLAWSLAMAP